jgi:hypothetical protein
MHQIDPPNGEKVIASTIGILHAFQFLEDVLLSRKPGKRKNSGRGRYDTTWVLAKIMLKLIFF